MVYYGASICGVLQHLTTQPLCSCILSLGGVTVRQVQVTRSWCGEPAGSSLQRGSHAPYVVLF